jgi:hypothetical protein
MTKTPEEMARDWAQKNVNATGYNPMMLAVWRAGAEQAFLAGFSASRVGWVMVPQSALDWLFGQGPDADGNWFEVDGNRPRYWWRSHFRKLIGQAIPTRTLKAPPLPGDGT